VIVDQAGPIRLEHRELYRGTFDDQATLERDVGASLAPLNQPAARGSRAELRNRFMTPGQTAPFAGSRGDDAGEVSMRQVGNFLGREALAETQNIVVNAANVTYAAANYAAATGFSLLAELMGGGGGTPAFAVPEMRVRKRGREGSR
jgi:hypothetical protein